MESIRAHEIATLLDTAPDDVEVLSLDCFDTLIWRNTNVPIDVFHDLDVAGGAMQMRAIAEKRARKAMTLTKKTNEVTLNDIYAHLYRDADETGIAAHVEAELAAEARHCFAFKPVVDLIAAAKARGLQVVIVSDTYLKESQLRALIAAAAGEETAARIDRIFCSCEYGQSKAGGLFTHVLADLNVSPARILHLGDHEEADFKAPVKLGVQGIHFKQFDAGAAERLRLEALAATLLEQDTRRLAPALQPHRAQVSLRDTGDAIVSFGHDVLGPIMHGFAHWVAEEADAIEAKTGKTPKLLFLLRDGYLPAEAFKALYPTRADDVAMVEISRFTGTAASFTDKQAIERYLLNEASNNRQDQHMQSRQAAYCRQMLFTPNETGKLSRLSGSRAFVREVSKPANIQKIVARSRRFAEGLFQHLRAAGVSDGDCVMLVDLGYNGSVQNAVEPVLRDGMNLSVHGRYLLLRETILSGTDKKGMIDARHYDFGALNSLCESIAVVEQLATLSQGSVLGYDEDGSPRRAKVDVKGQQSEMRDAAQAACLSYMREAGCGWASVPASWDGTSARRMAAASLARLLFFPVASEVAIFEEFIHDVNMGTSDVVKLIDPKAAAQGLRRRGLFYTKDATRMYLPGELKQQGIPALLSMFVGRRFGLDLRQSDFHGASIALPVVLMDAAEHVQVDIEAYPTSDGYYQALIPVGTGRFTAGIMVGQACEWVQVEEASFHAVDGFMEATSDSEAILATPIYESMSEAGGDLYRCPNENGFILVPPPSATRGEAMMLNFVFRPVVRRGALPAQLRQVA